MPNSPKKQESSYHQQDRKLQVEQNAEIHRNTKITILIGALGVLATVVQTILDNLRDILDYMR